MSINTVFGGNLVTVETVHNNGFDGTNTNKCFVMSLHHGMAAIGIPVEYSMLKTELQCNHDECVDTDEPDTCTLINKVCERYDIRIAVYLRPSDSTGKIYHGFTNISQYDSFGELYATTVYIYNTGLFHFELISKLNGRATIPRLPPVPVHLPTAPAQLPPAQRPPTPAIASITAAELRSLSATALKACEAEKEELGRECCRNENDIASYQHILECVDREAQQDSGSLSFFEAQLSEHNPDAEYPEKAYLLSAKQEMLSALDLHNVKRRSVEVNLRLLKLKRATLKASLEALSHEILVYQTQCENC